MSSYVLTNFCHNDTLIKLTSKTMKHVDIQYFGLIKFKITHKFVYILIELMLNFFCLLYTKNNDIF